MKNDGGSAYPKIRSECVGHTLRLVWSEGGMTLRDWFSAHAPEMPDWWYEGFVRREKIKADQDHSYIMRGIMAAMVEWEYGYADAKLAAREGKDG